jgi:hypothetical protein
VVAVVVTADTATAPCCDPAATSVSRGGSVASAVLPADCGTLDERRLVGMDVSDLSALAGTREGTVSATLRTRTRDQSPTPRNRGAPGENAAYLKLKKPRFLFLEGSRAIAATLVAATAALADASAARAASSTGRPAVGASAPTTGACSSAASAALGDEGGGSHLSRGAHPPSLSSPSSSSDVVFSGVAGVVWTSLGPLPRWVPGPTTRWAPGTT